jgi:hypothetical protein
VRACVHAWVGGWVGGCMRMEADHLQLFSFSCRFSLIIPSVFDVLFLSVRD